MPTTSLRNMALAGVAFAGMALTAVTPHDPASAQESAFRSGPWSGAAYGQSDGTFERCVITSEFEGRPTLGFGREASGRFEIWLLDPSWSYQAGDIEQVALSIDGEAAKTGTFHAVGPDRIAAQVNTAPGLVDGLKRGNRLTVRFGDREFTYPLTGTFNAISALDQCARDQGVRVIVDDNTRQRAAPESAEAQADRALRMLASVSGDMLFQLSPGDFAARIVLADSERFRIPQDLEQARQRLQADMVWSIADGFGLSKGVQGAPSEDALLEELLARRTEGCVGELSSSTDLRLSAVKERVIKRIEISCTEDARGNPAHEVFSFYPHETGNLVMVVHYATNLDSARTADEAFFRIAESVAASS